MELWSYWLKTYVQTEILFKKVFLFVCFSGGLFLLSLLLAFLPFVSRSWDVLNLHQGFKCSLNYKHKIRVCSPLISPANCYALPLAIWCERQLALSQMKFLHSGHEIVKAPCFKIACFRYLIPKQLSAVPSIRANGTIKLWLYVIKMAYLQNGEALEWQRQRSQMYRRHPEWMGLGNSKVGVRCQVLVCLFSRDFQSI